jgi:N-acetylglucosamine-6-phosphate deacetylase
VRLQPARGVHDPLFARALALGDGAARALLLSLDLIGVDAELTAAIRTRVEQATGVDAASVAVIATHTHGAPCVLSGGQLGSPDPQYRELVTTGAVQAAIDAVGRLTACQVRFASGSERAVASNRRDPAGPLDPAVEVLRFDAEGRCLGLLVSYACHPVVLGPDNLLLTRDYPGTVIDALEALYPGATVMFATGAAGQLNTGHSAHDSWHAAPAARRSFAEAERVGRLLAASALHASETAAAAPPAAFTPLRVASEQVTLATLAADPELPALQAAWRAELSGDATLTPERYAVLQAYLQWADSVPGLPAEVTVEVQALGFCGRALALFPGEVFVEYGLRVKERFAQRAVTLAYANSAPGYLPTRRALAEGGYEVAEAHRFYGQRGPFGPETEEALVGAMLDAVGRVLPEARFQKSPGWLDIQVNGFAGIDFNTGRTTPAEFEQARLALRAVGVTRFLPTVITADAEHLLQCLARIDEACRASRELELAMPGIHLEGPFISPLDGARGAHPLECVIPPDLQLFERLQAAAGGRIRLVTLAPEIEGSIGFIRELVSRGVRVAIGHSLADSAQLAAAADAGASLSTHLGNGLPGQLARHPNPLWDQLADDRLAASVIFDGHHLPDSVMRVLQRAKAPGRLILTSDAVALAGLKPGVYEGQVGGKVELHESGRLTMFGSEYLAGSASSLLDGVNTALRVTGLPLQQVLEFVTRAPERLLGLPPAAEQLLLRIEADGVAVDRIIPPDGPPARPAAGKAG